MRDVTLWQVAELSFDTEEPPFGGPVSIDAVFIGPSGCQIRRSAFWDGGRNWKIRFAATEVGIWEYSLHSSDHAGISGRTGKLKVREQEGPQLVRRHGFLRASKGSTHLEHWDGTPFFWLGDTHWRFTAERWDEANKPGFTSQFRGSVDRRVAQGFSVYQVNLMMMDWGGTTSPYFRPGTEEFNTDYFRDVLDPRINYLADQGLVIALGLGWYQIVDERPDLVERFARYVIARYGAHPVVWTLGGEVPGYEPHLRALRVKLWRGIAAAIRQADDYGHPISAHSTNERPLPADFVDDEWFAFAINQNGHGDLDTSPEHYLQFRKEHPGKPMVEGETFYEGLISTEAVGRRPVTDTIVRQAAYRAIQAGCCGFTYGAQGCWNAAWDRSETSDYWGTLSWSEGLDLPGATQMGHLRSFYEALPWHELKPFASCFEVADPLNALFYAPSVAANDSQSTVVIYFGETFRAGRESGVLTGMKDAPYETGWFDPRTGEYSTVDIRRRQFGALVVPGTPDQRDWLFMARTPLNESEDEDPSENPPLH